MTGKFMMKNCALVGLTALLLFISGGESQCVRVVTSEGFANLDEGGQACAMLQSNETEEDKGQRFITCIHRRVYIRPCPPGLRFDMRLRVCNWPHSRYCQLQGFNVEPTARLESETFTSPTPESTSTTTPEPSTTASTFQTTPTPFQTTPTPFQTTPTPFQTTPTPFQTTPTPFQTTPTPFQTTPTPFQTTSSTFQTTSQQARSGLCNLTSCTLPNCFCFRDSPADIPLEDMPMFILLTFDDHVSTNWYDKYYRALAVDNDFNLFNPSGNRPRFAFFVSEVNTNYSKVHALWEAGHEIGSHTIHHRLPVGDKDSDYPEMVAEIQGLKDQILKATGNKTLVDSIIGFRAPYLLTGGNVQYDVLRDFGFKYDTSLFNINLLRGKVPTWPYTLDYVTDECISPPCPTKPYPGLWSVPINGWIGDDGQGCSMADGCTVGTSSWVATEQEWYNYYRRNFEQYFYQVKVPMPIFIHSVFFDNYPRAHSGLVRWLQDTLRDHKNVWLVSPAQVIKWMENQMSNSDMIAQKWD